MMQYLILYFTILLPFCAMDAGWLTAMGPILYKPTLGDILLPALKTGPAIAFYVFYPVGLMIFAALPALKSGGAMTAILYGAAFGAIAYATYDLTNFATLRNWTLQITVLDICWGAMASAVAATVGYFLTRTISGWLGAAS
jgi:uncharacterized membrane protein